MNDLDVSISAAGPDVYRIEISRVTNRQPRRDEVQTLNAPRNLTTLAFDPVAGGVTVSMRNRPGTPALWSGVLRPLERYGRGRAPGLELDWTAGPDEAIYGLGQQFHELNQNGNFVEMWIRDAFAQGRGHTYYCSPVLFSSRGYALFAADNPEGEFDLNTQNDGRHRYRRSGERVALFLAFDAGLKGLLRKRALVQGQLRSVPDWAFGPWISRNSYETQGEAEEAIRGMAARNLPVAAIVQEAWKGPSETGDFNNFSKDRWPDPAAYFQLCREHDIRTILWQVPIIHPTSPDFAEAVRRGYFVKNPEGGVSHREEWLAGFANLDFTNPEAVAWWKERLRGVVEMGVAGFKADDGESIKPDDVFSDGRRGWEMHNHYSTLYNRALTELLDEEGVDGVLWARSGSLGIERFPALWAGDQYARWDQYRSLIPAGLNCGLSGMPFWGHDIGGYVDNPGPELYVRWLQFGAFSPLMQYHGIQKREPWEFGETAERAYKLLSHIRMNLRPTLIALGREAAETGIPLMRAMILEFPGDHRFRDESTQYMLGPDLLVAPVLEAGATGRKIRFPAGLWHHLLQPLAFEGPAEFFVPIGLVDAPVFVRDGAVLNVQLDKNAALGLWRREAPVRALTYPSTRATVRNLSVPETGNVLSRHARIGFEVAEGYETGLAVELIDPAGKESPAWFKVSRQGTVCSAELGLEGTAGFDQVERIMRILPSEDGRPGDVLYEARLRWQNPILMTTALDGPRVSRGGEVAVRTMLDNRSDEEITVSVRATAGPGLALDPVSAGGTAWPQAVHGETERLEAKALHPAETGNTASQTPVAAAEARRPPQDTDSNVIGGRSASTAPGISPAAATSLCQTVTVPAGRQTVLRWPIHLAPSEELSDTSLALELSVDGRAVSHQSVAFARPLTWIAVAPFPTGHRAAFRTPFPAEWSSEADVAFQGNGGGVQWEAVPPDHVLEFEGLDFEALYGEQENSAGYALTRILSDRDQDVELRIGSDDTLTVWLNGEKLHSVETYRPIAWDQEIVPARFHQGTNTVMVKVAQDVGRWRLQMHVCAPGGGFAAGLRDGFSEVTSYVRGRPLSARVLDKPTPLAWKLAGPFPFSTPDRQAGAGPLDDMASAPGWPIRDDDPYWRDTPSHDGYDGTVDLLTMAAPGLNCFAYAATRVTVEKETPVDIVCGSDDGMVLWLNGKKILEDHAYQEFRHDRHRVPATLRAGENVLFARIGQGDGQWKFRVDLWDTSMEPHRPLP